MPLHPVSGAELFYELTGSSGPGIVLVHGGGCDHRDWWRQVEALSRDFRVLTLDLRGHGRSSGQLDDCTIERWAADVNALILALGLGPATLVGHSLGSRIVAEAAWQAPKNAAALVLLDGSRSIGALAATQTPAEAPPAASLEAIIAATVGPYADTETHLHVQATMTATSMDVLQQCVAAYTAWDAKRADVVLPALELPVLAVQSTYHDRFTPRRSFAEGDTSSPYLQFMRQALPQLRVTILPDAGHFTMLERSSDVTAAIREFTSRQQHSAN
jgi:pimeloyl-ACP methyl ester carboxylesterase